MFMEYNDLINTFFNELDKSLLIKEIKELKTKLLNNKELLKSINTYHLTKSVSDKKKLYEYPDYVRYLTLENEVNILINNIKRKIDFTSRKCNHESN